MLVIWRKKIGRCSTGLIGIVVAVVKGRRVRMNLKGIAKDLKIKIIEDTLKDQVNKVRMMKAIEKGRFMIKMLKKMTMMIHRYSKKAVAIMIRQLSPRSSLQRRISFLIRLGIHRRLSVNKREKNHKRKGWRVILL